MRGAIIAVCGTVAAAWFCMVMAASEPAVTAEPVAAPPLVVHEWGTFTNFSGSDGVQLEYRPLAVNDLPNFVRNCWDRSGHSLLFGKSSVGAFQRMETPVTYFYTPVERDVRVRVRFPQGLLTEFFPPVAAATPAEVKWRREGDPASPELKDGSVDWGTVHLIPIESLSPRISDPVLAKSMGHFLAEKIVPPAATHPHYGHARATDSALINVRVGKDHQDSIKGDYFEKFLFYRGVGNFKLPLALEARGKGEFSLTNSGADAVRSLFLVTVRGGELRFSEYERIDGNATRSLAEGSQPVTVDDLAKAMTTALVNEGLYRKEAEAMVNSWRDSWFAEEGTRLFYMVPQRITDELLPLEITPKPDELVRVLVGRMEIMPPEEEGRILALVQRSATARQLEQADPGTGAVAASRERTAAFAEVVALGRFAEPALVRARHTATDAALRIEAAKLIDEVRALDRK